MGQKIRAIFTSYWAMVYPYRSPVHLFSIDAFLYQLAIQMPINLVYVYGDLGEIVFDANMTL